MGLLAVVSLHGSPGATTVACALAAAAGNRGDGGDALLVEADPDGGVLAARLQLQLQPSLTDLAGAARAGIEPSAVPSFSQPVAPGVDAVVAHPSGEQAAAALRTSAGHLAAAFRGLGRAVVVDAGRMRAGTPALPLLESADRVLVVVRPDLAHVVWAMHGTTWIADRVSLGLVVVGRKPYSPRQVGEVTGLDVVATVDDDPDGASDPFARSRRRRGWASALAEVVDLRRPEVDDQRVPFAHAASARARRS